MATVELCDVDKFFPGDVHAVAEFSLSVADGELLVLVGPSGCGKSTVLRMIAGLESVSSGEIRIGGQVVNNQSPQARNIAMVFQNYALYPHKTVRANLEFPLRMMGWAKSERRRRVDDVAALLGLSGMMEKRPKQLSGGQRQRVAMGRALVREPAVFLLDEPLSNLDAKLRVQIRYDIAQLQRQTRTTTVYVTHDQVEAMTLGHRVAVMLDGRLQQVATGPQLYEDPANIFVAGFIGSPAMNIFRTRLTRSEARFAIAFGDRSIPLPDRLADRWRLERHGQDICFAGLRPEAFSLAGPDDGRFAFEADVRAVEALGHENIIFLESPVELEGDPAGGGESGSNDLGALAVRIPAAAARPARGKTLRVAIDPDALYLFDSRGQSLRHR